MNRIAFPRIFNFLVIALILAGIYTLVLSKNTAQEVPASAPSTTPVTEAPVTLEAKPAEAKAEEVKPEETKAEEAKPIEEAKPAADAPPTFPVVEGESNATPASFAAAAEEPAQTSDEPKAPKLEFWQSAQFSWIVLLVLLFGCFFIGQSCSKAWRLPEHNIKIFIVTLAFFGSIAAVALGWHRLTLGIDLQGGVVLIYDAIPNQLSDADQQQQQPGTSKGTPNSFDMDKLTRAITRRINPGGVREIAITKLGTRQIQVIIPNAEPAEVARIERVISESGSLTFRILASRLYPQDDPIIKRGEKETGRDVRDAAGKLLARWVPIAEAEQSSFIGNPDIVTRQRHNAWETLILYNDGVDITGEYLNQIGKGSGENAEPGVSFSFNAVGANKFKRLTSANKPDSAQSRLKRQLGIILNDSLYSAPSINAVIGEHGIITFSRRDTDAERMKLAQDIEDLINVLNAGALPADLSKEPVGKMQIGATLGADTIEKAKFALIASAIAIMIFMVVYYHLAGLIACFCVITNTTLLIAVMLALRAAFTLPGLAGLVLTIGMAVDANILIYERIREELTAGASLKMAIRNGYAKAFSAIFDSNITTILIGIILYVIGTEQVKGFAVTLVLGIALNMFTAIYCARVIMDVFESQRWVKTFRMLQLFKRPNINFLGSRVPCMVFSVTCVIIGLVAVYERGMGIFDIDFVGGVSVEATFNASQDVQQIRSKLIEKDKTISEEENRLNDISVQPVQLTLVSAENQGASKAVENTHFIITTAIPQLSDKREISPEAYLATVQRILKETFGNSLVYCKFDYNISDTQKDGEREETEVKINIFPSANHDAVTSALDAAIKKAVTDKIIDNEISTPTVTREGYVSGSQNSYSDWTLKFYAPKETLEKILAPMKAEHDETPYFPTATTVGGSVAKYTRVAGLMAILASLVAMVLYIRFRFHRLVYGLVAALGLFHDVLIVLGLVALSAWITTPVLLIDEFKIGLPVVAAFLAIIGYSINDTIILFDRIRENLGKSPDLTGKMINNAINQTLSRTVLTSLTTFIVSAVLYVFGGQGIHTFAFTISLGVAFGTYSTIGFCAPMLYWCVSKEPYEPHAVAAEK